MSIISSKTLQTGKIDKMEFNHVIIKKMLTISALTFILTSCIETKEEAEARRMQFNGQTLPQAYEIIGKPDVRDNTKAIWQYSNSYTQQIPIQNYKNGRWITNGYRTEYVNLACTYTAHLSGNRIISSEYKGNSCRRFAPTIKKKI